jgi:hypothetical protein
LCVIAHANDEEQRYDPKKECLHSFPPLKGAPPRANATGRYRGSIAQSEPVSPSRSPAPDPARRAQGRGFSRFVP